MDSKTGIVVAIAIVCVLLAIVVTVKSCTPAKPDEAPKGTPTSPEDAQKFGGEGAANPTRVGGAHQ
jgi:hypothetical protein